MQGARHANHVRELVPPRGRVGGWGVPSIELIELTRDGLGSWTVHGESPPAQQVGKRQKNQNSKSNCCKQPKAATPGNSAIDSEEYLR